MSDETGIPEEIIELNDAYLPPARQDAVEGVVRRLREDPHLELMLAVLEVRINDRPLAPAASPGRPLLKKLLQALDEESGEVLLYGSPYNDLGRATAEEAEPRVEWWNFDLGDRLCEFADLRSVRAFLEHGTGVGPRRDAAEAQALHDRLLRALVGESRGFAVYGCMDIRTPGALAAPRDCPAREGIWPAEDVSPWFHGVFWDDLLFILNPPESTLVVLAITSS